MPKRRAGVLLSIHAASSIETVHGCPLPLRPTLRTCRAPFIMTRAFGVQIEGTKHVSPKPVEVVRVLDDVYEIVSYTDTEPSTESEQLR